MNPNEKAILVIGCGTSTTAKPLTEIAKEAKEFVIVIEDFQLKDKDFDTFYKKQNKLDSHLSSCLDKKGGRKQKKRYPHQR